MRLKWGRKEDNEWSWWSLFVMLAVMIIIVILKVR